MLNGVAVLPVCKIAPSTDQTSAARLVTLTLLPTIPVVVPFIVIALLAVAGV